MYTYFGNILNGEEIQHFQTVLFNTFLTVKLFTVMRIWQFDRTRLFSLKILMFFVSRKNRVGILLKCNSLLCAQNNIYVRTIHLHIRNVRHET